MAEKEYAGADTEDEGGAEERVIEVKEAEEAELLKELEFIKLSGRQTLRITRFSKYLPDDDSDGDPAVIFGCVVTGSEVEEENSVEVDIFAPLSGPRRKEFTKLQLALGMRPRIPREVDDEFLEDFVDREFNAIMRAYKVKRGERKGQWRNSVAEYLFGAGQEKLDDFLKR